MIAPMVQAYIDEIFSSIQGEGPWLGERQTFVRFFGCDIRCRYCDTLSAAGIEDVEKEQSACRVQESSDAFTYRHVPNPVSAHHLTDHCVRLLVRGRARPVISLTGGEPLLHCDFLREWLPEMKEACTIYLETNGIQHEAIKELHPWIDRISMDLKLPSATGLKPFWNEHEKFLAGATGSSLFAKAVVTADTESDDLLMAARLIAGHDPGAVLVIQPATGALAPDPGKLLALQAAALEIASDVRIIPQVHTMLRLP